MERQQIVCCRWWESSLLSRSPLVTVSHLHHTSLDTPELGPGAILGPSSSSVSASTGPTNAYPSTLASSSSSYSTSSVSRDSSSGSATPIPIGGHSSNTGAIVGGVAGGIAAISIVIAALLFYLRLQRRHPPAPPAGNMQPSEYNPFMDQVPRPLSGQGTVASSLPETTTSLPRPYVCVFVTPALLMYTHMFYICYNAQNTNDPTTYPTYKGTLPPPTYNPIQSPSSSSSRNMFTIATAPSSQGQGRGYNGLPVV
jgi:hypothetical protein